ncbi:hypothetical protein [Brevibacillus fulvus]|uniref:Uncharacterized protein n=1 Tax=Brevibacillus fulvus TaxID=1125967 RepID=A0A938XW21_9BACL|nr:hypothetical protein [Brevibacillus fulvus]MBM7588755.1 hypothetical protein [Brevibacillus fulvus]
MYIRREWVWWLVPVFAALFCIGMLLGNWLDKPENRHPSVVASPERFTADREVVEELIRPLSQERSIPFSVWFHNNTLSGHFRANTFELSGTITGHQLTMKRDAKEVSVLFDGQPQNPQLLPYSLYTPYEHAAVIRAQLQSIDPLPISDPVQQQWLGYEISLPPDEVKSMIALWLGPHFPVDDVLDEVLDQVRVKYQLWYEPEQRQLRQLVVDLQLDTPNGKKQDQLLFRL